MEPVDGENFRIQFPASRELRDKLLEAQALLRNRGPQSGLARIIESGVDLLIAKVKKERFGVGRKSRPASASALERRPSRHIPDEIKRLVWERDGGRCTFRDEHGRRCTSTEIPEFQHDDGFARTGIHDPARMRLLCHAHNQADADQMYGRDFMDRHRNGPKPDGELVPGRVPVSNVPIVGEMASSGGS